ncbi:odorant receptor 94a-like [Topomyia yanbarensis]|uniref:odorant receptor 94a-like n=1 Tax=Topomyia yanbarensis TaxID=2498891 RepID=UPI00273C8D40|nr:odorant receptor 94a-like [Topomyia yanbarensis]
MDYSEFIFCERVTFWIWKVYGIWTTKDDSSFYRAFRWIYHFFFTFLYIFAMFVSSFFTNNPEELWSEVMFMLLTELAMCTKLFILVNNFSAVLRLHQTTVSRDFLPKTDHDLKTRGHILDRFSKAMLAYYFCSLASVMSNIGLLFGDSYKLPYSNWFYWVPLGKDHQRNYHIMFAYQIFGMVGHCSLNVAADIQVVYLLIAAGFQLDNLKDEFANLPILSTQTHVEKQIYRRTLVEHIKNFVKEVEQIFSMAVFTQACASGITICAVMFALSSMSIFDLEASIPMLFYLIAMLLQIFLPCMFGNEITFKSHQLTNAIFSSDWYKLSGIERKDVMRLMLRTSKPITLKAGHFFYYSLETFTSTLNTAYSIYAVLNRRKRATR